MTPAAYASFYETGAYRALLRAAFPRMAQGDDLDLVEGIYGEGVMQLVAKRVSVEPTDLLDAGGSTGAVSRGILKASPMRSVTVLDPSRASLTVAKSHGFQTLLGTLEDFTPERTYGAIVCAHTVDHLLDPMKALRALRAVGTGWLWIDLVECVWKIDHPLSWTPASLQEALTCTGWTVKGSWGFGPGKRTGVVCV